MGEAEYIAHLNEQRLLGRIRELEKVEKAARGLRSEIEEQLNPKTKKNYPWRVKDWKKFCVWMKELDEALDGVG